jgi:hypothetical protein
MDLQKASGAENTLSAPLIMSRPEKHGGELTRFVQKGKGTDATDMGFLARLY